MLSDFITKTIDREIIDAISKISMPTGIKQVHGKVDKDTPDE